MTDAKKNFVQRVLAHLKGGEEAQLKRFHKKTVKYCTDQIRIRKDKIEEIGEKLEDKQEEYADALLDIAEDKIKSVDVVIGYVPDYVGKMFAYHGHMDSLKAEIKLKEKEIARFEALKKDLA